MKRISAKRIRQIRQDYLAHFPGWKVIGSAGICRLEKPILQLIVFEPLSFGEYRPTAGIQVMVVPQEASGMLELPQLLASPSGAPAMSYSEKRHGEVCAAVAERLNREVVPPTNTPITLPDLITAYASRAIPRAEESISIASLLAYQDDGRQALIWLDRFETLVAQRRASGLLHGREPVEFATDLRSAIRSRSVPSLLETIWRDNVTRLGVAN